MVEIRQVFLKRSADSGSSINSPKLPETLEFGELAMNYGDGHEALILKNDNDEMIVFSSDESIYNYCDNTYASKSDLETLSGSVIELSAATIQDEFVISQALNDLDERIIELSGNSGSSELLEQLSGAVVELSAVSQTHATKEEVAELSAVTLENELVTAEALNDLYDKIIELSGNSGSSELLEQLSGSVIQLSAATIEDEYITSRALNDLNNKIIELSGNSGSSELLEQLSGSVVELSAATIDNELIVAEALNDLNDRIDNIPIYSAVSQFINDAGYITEEDLEPLSGAVVELSDSLAELSGSVVESELVISQAFNAVNERINNIPTYDLGPLSGSVIDLSAATYEIEFVLSLAVNDLQERIDGMTSGGSGSYITTGDVKNIVESYNYVNSGNVKTQIESYGYITDASLSDYYTSAQTNTQINNAIAAESARTEATYLKAQNLDGLFASADYVSSAKTIAFYDKDNDLVDSIDATAFIKDGMVDDVVISGDSLVITFNTDAGKEDIALELSDIFDPDNYYSKTDIDNKKFVNSGDVKTQIESYGYTTNTGTITGVNMNGASKGTSGVVDLGTVITAETQLSTATTGNGNAITDISVSNHQITMTKGATFTTTGDVETQITGKNYVTSGNVETQITGKNYVTSAQTKSQIESYGYTTNTGTITGVNMNGASKGTSGVVDLGTVLTAETQLSTATTGNGNAITDISVNNHQITMTKGVTFTTTGDVETQITGKNYVTSAQTKSQIEGYGYITGYTETDPTVPSWAKAANKPSYTASEVGALPTGTTLDNVGDGTTRKLSDYATVSNFTAHTGDTNVHVNSTEKSTWNGKQDEITDLSTIRNNASSGASAYTAVTAHTGNTALHLPTVSSTDNGKILQVVNGVWTLVTPITIYTGQNTPASSLGNNGDIYLQTS